MCSALSAESSTVPVAFLEKLYLNLVGNAADLEAAGYASSVSASLRSLAAEVKTFALPHDKDEQLKGCHIMIVEDNDMNAIVAMKYFGGAGALPVLARSANEALKKLESTKNLPEVVLVDIHMSGMDGIELAQEIRKRPALRNVTLFAVTSDGTEKTRLQAIGAGVDAYFQKPVNFSELADVIAARISGSDSTAFFHPQKQIDTGGDVPSPEEPLLSPERAAECIGSKELYHMAVTAFLKDAPAILSEVDKKRKCGKAADVLRDIHSLKGLAGTVGADRLFAELSHINVSLKEDVPLSPEEFRMLLSVMGVTVEAIENYLKK